MRKLPKAAIPLASGEHELHQAFRVGQRAWGVQFHPEFSASVMRKYIRQMEKKLVGEGCDVQALDASIIETPESAMLLRRFAEICNGD